MQQKEWHNSSMKITTSVTLSKELLSAIEEKTGKKSCSAFIENAVWSYMKHQMKADFNLKDLAIINTNVDLLNTEAMDTLDYQEPI